MFDLFFERLSHVFAIYILSPSAGVIEKKQPNHAIEMPQMCGILAYIFGYNKARGVNAQTTPVIVRSPWINDKKHAFKGIATREHSSKNEKTSHETSLDLDSCFDLHWVSSAGLRPPHL